MKWEFRTEKYNNQNKFTGWAHQQNEDDRRKLNELEDRLIENIRSEQQRVERWKNKQILRSVGQ